MKFSEFVAVQKRLMRYLAPYWLVTTAAVVCTFLVTFAKLSQAKFIGLMFQLMANGKNPMQLVDPKRPFAHQINGHDPGNVLNFISGGFLLMMLMMGVATYFQRYWVNLGGQLATRDVRAEVFSHVQRLSLSFFDQMRLGEIHSRSSGDVSTATGIFNQLADFLTNLLIVVIALSLMFYKDWQMTLVVLLLSPLIAVAVGTFGNRIGRITEHLQSRVADLSAIMYESMSSIKVVKAFNRENFEIERFRVKNQESYDTQMALVKVAATQTPVVEFLGAFGIVAIVWLGAQRIIYHGFEFGDMAEYWTLMVMTTQPVSALSGFYSSFQASAAAAKRVFVVLDAPSETEAGEQHPPLPAISGSIDFEHVTFAYEEDKPVLRDLDLHIKPGEILAIVGANGAGKTTLVNLVSRFYKATEGVVRVDGHDLTQVDLASLRNQIGVVIQESVLFSGTIAENIACGNLAFTQEEILAASKLANAHEFIERLEEGYDTQIGERGMRLSGGQRQRIAIARALLRNPRILILDEFTSGIDAESENLITDAIEKSMKGRTCLVIAHRLNTIRHADRVICLNQGRIAEEGTHQELMALDGLYAKIYQSQLKSPASPNGVAEVVAVGQA